METGSDNFPVVFRAATASDREDVRDALGRFFFPEEPITISYYGGSEVTADDMNNSLSLIDDGFVTLAVDGNSDKIVGISAGSLIEPNEAEKLMDLASNAETVKFADILHFLAHMVNQADIFQRLAVTKVYHIHSLAVAPEVRERSLGTLLVRKQFEQARQCGAQAVSTDATGVHSARIFKKLGMENVYSISYEKYRNASHQQVFVGKEPHLEATTFAMLIGNRTEIDK
ncbi:uncharacterized protein LOC131437974 [Malaya genurostris]|uniref:uncharacterized protein LOC131437974 n=1 Tax=Malaya genurostris TaxID=325434 RepID=UPI0026F3961A|nr:uncharacterized protein LOC131437974 [Malaya genurostris]